MNNGSGSGAPAPAGEGQSPPLSSFSHRLDGIIASLRTAPSRTGSLIATVYGDAILPRGGSLSLSDLLTLMRRLGASDGVVRTAVSRLARDGLLEGRRAGRHSTYALTPHARAEFAAAIPLIYGPIDRPWDGHLHLAFPETGADRGPLEAAGFALLAPGVLISPSPPPAHIPSVRAHGCATTLRALAARAWPMGAVGQLYDAFLSTFTQLQGQRPPTPLDAIAARTLLIHAWRRIALRDPRLPAALAPADWPARAARTLCTDCYAALASQSETWLDGATAGSDPLPAGPDPASRFSAADTRPAATASSPSPTGNQRPPRSATT